MNKEFYEPYQIVIINSFFKFDKLLGEEEKAVKKSSINNFEFNNTRHSFYTYDKSVFLKNIDDAKKEYNKAKSIMKLALEFEDKIRKIENLNKENKKKSLFNKYTIVLNDFQTKYNNSLSIDEHNNVLNEANMFLDKVIALYSTDTKSIENQLKSAETVEQIKSIIK